MRIEEAADVPAAKKLLAHIRGLRTEESPGTIPDFCDRHGLVRQKVERAIKHGLKRADLAFVLAIKKATGGAVDETDWVPQSKPGDAA